MEKITHREVLSKSEGSTSVTRRSAMQSVGAFLGLMSVPATVAIVKAKASEDHRLVEMAPRIDAAISEHKAAMAAKDTARAMADRLCPPVPDDLVIGRGDRGCAGLAEDEVDVEGRTVYPATPARPRLIAHVDRLRRCATEKGIKPDVRKRAKRLLPIAETYEAARDEAIAASGLHDAMERLYFAELDLYQMAREEVAEIRALTLEGVAIKVRLAAHLEYLRDQMMFFHRRSVLAWSVVEDMALIAGGQS